MSKDFEKIMASYFKYYPKNDLDKGFQFLFKFINKEELLANKEKYISELKRIKFEGYPSYFTKEEFNKTILKLKEVDHSSKPLKVIKEVVTLRFAPNPNFIPTLGNLRGWLLNKHLLDSALPGSQLFLRLDDSDPKNKPATEEGIEGYINLVNDYLPETKIYRCSTRLQIYYEKAKKYLEQGLLTIESYSGKEPLKIFEEMIYGLSEYKKIWAKTSLRKECCLRVIPLEEQKLKNQKGFCLYPTLIYQTTLDDHLLGVTHAARGKDLIQVGRRQESLSELFSLKMPKVLYWGRIKILSNKGIEKISSSEYSLKSSNQDKTLYTYQYFRKRGYGIKTLEKFILSYGFTENDIVLDLKRLDHFKKLCSSTDQ